MRGRGVPDFLLLLAGWLAALAVSANGLPDVVTRALDQAGIPLDAVAVVIAPASGGEATLSLNARQPMNPASTMKLLTSYAALRSLGPTHTWKTSVWTVGELRDGKLMGDLVVRGGGDPFLTVERLWLMQRKLRQLGVREIHGNLVLDLSLYADMPQDAASFDGEPLAAYNALPAPLVVNFNVQNLTFAALDDGLQIQPEWSLPGLRVVSTVSLTDAPCHGWRNDVQLRVPDPAVAELHVGGSFPRSCGSKTLALNLFDAPLNFAYMFRALWEESGGVWRGQMLRGSAPASPPLLQFESLPLAELLRPINKYSSNIMTRMLYLDLGIQQLGAPATLDKSATALRDILQRDGLQFGELVLENGAGLSRAERISAASMAMLLQVASSSAHFSEFESSLPIAARDGTLKNRMNGNAGQTTETSKAEGNGSVGGVAGHAHLKTGSLKDVRALAGYVHDRRGRRWVLVFFINHPAAARGIAAQDALVEWLHQQGGHE